MRLRATPARLALSYIALGVLALASLAIPLWGFQAGRGVAGGVAIVLTLGLVFVWFLRRAHGELEQQIAQRTAALELSEERYERAMLAAEAGFWDWDVRADDFYVSPKLLQMTDFAPGTRFAGRADFMARAPFHPEDRAKWERSVKELFASGGTRLAMEIRSIHGAETRWALRPM